MSLSKTELKQYIQGEMQRQACNFEDLGLQDDDIIFFQQYEYNFLKANKINFRGNDLSEDFTSQFFEIAKNLKNLNSISFSENKKLSNTNKFLEQLILFLYDNQQIISIDLSRIGFDHRHNEKLLSLIQLENLRYINLDWNYLDDNFLKELMQITKLQKLKTVVELKGNKFSSLHLMKQFQYQQKMNKANFDLLKENNMNSKNIERLNEDDLERTRTQKIQYFQDEQQYNKKFEVKLRQILEKFNSDLGNMDRQISSLQSDCQILEQKNQQKRLEVLDLSNYTVSLKSKLKDTINKYNCIKNKNLIEKRLRESFIKIYEFQKDQLIKNQQVFSKDLIQNYQQLNDELINSKQNKKLIIEQQISCIESEIDCINQQKKIQIEQIQQTNLQSEDKNTFNNINKQKQVNLHYKKVNNLQQQIDKLKQKMIHQEKLYYEKIEEHKKNKNQNQKLNQNIQDFIKKLKDQVNQAQLQLQNLHQDFNIEQEKFNRQLKELDQLKDISQQKQNMIYQDLQTDNQRFEERQQADLQQIQNLDKQIFYQQDQIADLEDKIRIEKEKRQLGIQLIQNKLEQLVKKALINN